MMDPHFVRISTDLGTHCLWTVSTNSALMGKQNHDHDHLKPLNDQVIINSYSLTEKLIPILLLGPNYCDTKNVRE